MAVNYDKIRAELTLPQYRGVDVETAAKLMNGPRSIVAPIPADAVLKLWSQLQILAACDETLFDLRAKGGDLATRITLNATVNNLRGKVFADLDVNDPEQRATINKYLDTLIGAGVLTPEQRDATLALAVNDTQDGWRAFGDRELDYNDIKIAMSGGV